ncbi:MAG: transcription termination factor Rho, partial [Alphaproteobacteria bacterium]
MSSTNTLTLRYNASGSSSESKPEKITNRKNYDNSTEKETNLGSSENANNANELSNSSSFANNQKADNHRETNRDSARDSSLRLNRGNLISRGSSSPSNGSAISNSPSASNTSPTANSSSGQANNALNNSSANNTNFNEDEDDDLKSEKKSNSNGKTLELKFLKSKSAESLIEIAKEYGIETISDYGRQDIIYHILKNFSDQNPENVIIGEGVLEVLEDGFGFLRAPETNYFPGSDDIYVSPSQIKRFALRTGDTVKGQIRAPKKGERYFALLRVNEVNLDIPEKIRNRVLFDDLTPLYPQKKLNLEEDKPANNDFSTRIIDMITPLGKGQRALIVAPPRTGKTSLMQNIARSITTNHPEIILLVLLIDERPEEVTDMIRSVKGEVVSSTFDEPASRHVQLAEMVIEKARRLVEAKKDVVILLDNITRLAR